MLYTVKSYNGVALNDTNYQTWLPADGILLAGASIVEVERSGNDPFYAGKKNSSRVIPLRIRMKGVVKTQVDTLMSLFDPQDRELHTLVLIDTDTAAEWNIEVTPNGLPLVHNRNLLDVILYAQGSTLDGSNLVSPATWNVTASGDTNVFTPVGNSQVFPTITISPQAAKADGYLYRRWVPIYNSINREFATYPVELTNGGLDTATLIGAGKMQADGDDWRALLGGVEVNRWIAGINTASSKMWININLSPTLQVDLKTAIAGAGAITAIDVKVTTSNKQALKKLTNVPNKVVLIGTEAFTFTGVDISVSPYQITGVTRAKKDTAAAAHSVNDTIYWIENDIWIVYGNSALEAPETIDDFKPIFNLSTSSNTSWDLDEFGDETLRPGSFIPNVVRNTGGECGVYTAEEATDITPYEEIGMAIRAYFSSGAWRSGTGIIRWSFYHPAGITAVTASGEAYREAGNWATFAGLKKSKNNETFSNVWNESKPTANKTWEAVSAHSSVSLGSTHYYLRFQFSGSVGGSADNAIYLEYSDITLTLDSTRTPAIALYAESANYNLDLILTNTANDSYIQLQGICAIADVIIVDNLLRTVTFTTGEPAQNMKVNSEWITLEVGANTLEYVEPSVTDVDVDFSWYAKRKI